jgi:hypothetical protein
VGVQPLANQRIQARPLLGIEWRAGPPPREDPRAHRLRTGVQTQTSSTHRSVPTPEARASMMKIRAGSLPWL